MFGFTTRFKASARALALSNGAFLMPEFITLFHEPNASPH